jgi:hypothetical protein
MKVAMPVAIAAVVLAAVLPGPTDGRVRLHAAVDARTPAPRLRHEPAPATRPTTPSGGLRVPPSPSAATATYEMMARRWNIRQGAVPSPTAAHPDAAAPSTRAAAPAAAAVQTPYVTACGTSLCLHGAPWHLYGATIYSGYDDPVGRIALAKQAGLNTLRLVNFIDPADTMSDLSVAKNWLRLDKMIADAQQQGLKVILDLSDYRNLLVKSGLNPYTIDWAPFLALVAGRHNTVTGVRYANDPTIALVSLAGEVEPINSPKNILHVTTSQVTDFFRRTFAEWHTVDPNHLVSTGGLGQLDWPSGVDWKSIMALPGDDVCTIIIYGESTTATVPPLIGRYCSSAGRPWITEEFGTPIENGDAARAAAYTRIMRVNKANGSAGTAFWNLGPETIPASFDVNPSSPLLWQAVLANAPRS